MGKTIKWLINGLYIAFAIEIFLTIVDALSATNFRDQTYTVFGFFIIYLYTLIVTAFLVFASKD